MASGASHLRARVSPTLLELLDGVVENALPDDCIERLVSVVAGAPRWGAMFGDSLPGLLIGASTPFPFEQMSGKLKRVCHELRIQRWDDFAQVTPFDILGVRQTGEVTLTEIVRIAVHRALTAVDDELITNSDESTDEPSTHDASLEATRLLPAGVGSALETVIAWGTISSGAATVGDALLAVMEAADLPSDIDSAKRALLTSPVRSDGLPVVHELFIALLAELEARQRDIYLARVVISHGPTLQQLADAQGVTRERIRQLETKAIAHVSDLLGQTRYRPLAWKAHALRPLLGGSTPLKSDVYDAALEQVLSGCPPDKRHEISMFLLHVAGYTERAGWVVRADAAELTYDMVAEHADEHGLIEADTFAHLLTDASVAAPDHAAIVERIGGLRDLGSHVALWRGTVTDKVVRILAVRGVPLTPDDLAAQIAEKYSVRSLRNALASDARLARVSKTEWGLRSWGFNEYTGVADEIAEEIVRQGGVAVLNDVVERLTAQFGVAPNSVRAYAQTPRFVLEDGHVRLREEDERVVMAAPIAEARGCFQLSASSVSLCAPVDKEMLRGSGRALPVAVATFLGLQPGDEGRFDVNGIAGVTIVLTWPTDSVAGPSLGSTRTVATHLGANDGDILSLTFDASSREVESRLIVDNANLSAIARLEALTGLSFSGANAIDVLAESLGVERADVRACLHRRGDSDLLALLPSQEVDSELEAALAELEESLAAGG